MRVAAAAEVPEGAVIEVLHGGVPYAVCNIGGEVRALLGVCPHHGGPLGQGALEGGVLACPWHCWPFDSATGVCGFNPDLSVAIYAVRVTEGSVFVDLP